MDEEEEEEERERAREGKSPDNQRLWRRAIVLPILRGVVKDACYERRTDKMTDRNKFSFRADGIVGRYRRGPRRDGHKPRAGDGQKWTGKFTKRFDRIRVCRAAINVGIIAGNKSNRLYIARIKRHVRTKHV